VNWKCAAGKDTFGMWQLTQSAAETGQGEAAVGPGLFEPLRFPAIWQLVHFES